jgi:adenosylmethionine-8-amino-7-oxononanoate aminotransferase
VAKNSAPVAVRSAKPKTAAQIAKRDRNIKEAADRLQRLQAKQKLVKQLRGMGLTGTDDEIVDQYITQQRIAEAASYVKAVLATPNAGQIIQRWLKGRITMAPTYVKELITKFLNRDGSIEGQKDNSELKAAVESHLNVERRLAELKVAA